MTASNLAARALIAEDEPLLTQALQSELALAWPDLAIARVVGDGMSAVTQALALRPDVLFFDIRMPGLDGLDAAAELADQWDTGDLHQMPFPCLVFVTAFDQYAVQAFEAHAVDYLLKPVQPQRLRQTVERVQRLLQERRRSTPQHAGLAATVQAGRPHAQQDAMEATLTQLRQLLQAQSAASAAPPLSVITASVGNTVHLLPLDDVIALEAADKYVRVVVRGRDFLIRTPLRELLPRLDPQQFWQVHRGAVVRARAIVSVSRDESGRLWLQLRGYEGRIAVSRLFAHLFKAM